MGWCKLQDGTFSFYEKDDVYLLVTAGNQNNDSGSSEFCMADRRHGLPGDSSAAFHDRKVSQSLARQLPFN